MPPHLVAPRRQVAKSQNPQPVEQASRLNTQRRAKVVKAENVGAPGARNPALKPAPHLDKIAATLAVFRIRVAQVASNRVFQNRQQKFQLALDHVIAPDQVGVLSRQQQSGVG